MQSYRIACALLSALFVGPVIEDFWLVAFFMIYGYFTTAVALTAAASVAVAVAVAIVVVVGGAAAVSGAGIVAGAVAGAEFFRENYQQSLLLLVLFFMLPIFNSCLDWVSWACSRHFLTRASREDRVFPIIRDIGIDLALAVVFMGLICLLIPAGAELLNALYSHVASDVQFDWRSLAKSAGEDPWGEGLMVTMMVLSTLIPTVIHIVLAL